MKQIFILTFLLVAAMTMTSCSDNKAAEAQPVKKTDSTKKQFASPKPDGFSIGSIETGTYTLKLHRAFTFAPKGSDVLTGFKPKEGYKFIYLDASLRNTGAEHLNGDFIFIALKVTDQNGKEYKKPSTGLAAYTTEHPEDTNPDEYNALWEDFAPNEFHRDIIFCVEVPSDSNSFVLHVPADPKRKEWKSLAFSVD